MAAIAETPILSAPDAVEALSAENIVLIDIRSPEEWAETGLAQGAWPVSMHEQGFPERLQAIFALHPPETVAMICATGGRTAYVAEILEKNGIAGVIDLSEGMMGNDRGPGWIARGLPVVPVDQASAAYHAAIPQP